MSGMFWIFAVIIAVIIIVGVGLAMKKKECDNYKENGKCVDKCENKIYDFTTGSCVESCPSGTVEISDGDWKGCTKCPEGKIYKDGSCIDQKECNGVYKVTKNGLECVNNCGEGYFSQDGLCIPDCKLSQAIHPITFKCVNKCPEDFPVNRNGFCSK
jgi:hypothetical protein